MESWSVAKSQSQSTDFGQSWLILQKITVYDGHIIQFVASDYDSIQSEDRACLLF